MSRLTPSLLAAALGAVTVLTAPPSVSAPPQREVIHDEFSQNVDDFCDVAGFDIHNEGLVTGTSVQRFRGPAGIVYFTEHLNVTSTFTNRATGHFVTAREHTITKDLRITDNGDGTLTIIVLATGNFAVFGENGKAIARNPGQVRFRIVIDHNGTPSNPDDDVELSFEQIKDSTGRSDDFCAAVVAAIG